MTATSNKPFIYEGSGSAIDNYNSPKPVKAPTKEENWGLFDKKNMQHKAVLSLLRQIRWTVPHDRHGEVADLIRLSEFLKSDKSPVKKPLLKMTQKEVSKIIVALEGVQTFKYKKR